MNREVTAVYNFLKAKSINIPLNNEWLTSCVGCFMEQGNYTIRELSDLVYQQWLLADLSDIGVQVIPNGCFSADKFILEGKYAVQLNYFVNVAMPFHKQLQKIRRPDAVQNLEVEFEGLCAEQFPKDEPKGSRILKIELTDGVVTIIGFEDQYIPSLQEPFVPGKKAILVGPIECRKSVMFLKPKNIIVLGGEVDALHIPNATENILARKLKLPENPDPYSQHLSQEYTDNDSTFPVTNVCLDEDEEAMMMLAEVIEKKVPEVVTELRAPKPTLQQNIAPVSCENNLSASLPQATSQNQYNNSTIHSLKPNNHPPKQSSHQSHRNSNVSAKVQSVFSIGEQPIDLDFDDDFDLLAAQTTVAAEQNKKSAGPSCIDTVASKLQTYEMFDSAPVQKDLKQITELKQKLNESYCDKRDSWDNNRPTNSTSDSLHFREDGKILVDYLNDKVSPLEQLPLEPGSSLPISQSIGSQENSFTIEPFPPRKRPAIVSAFSRVVKVLKKPRLKEEKWAVSALVEAKGIELEVTFESHVIDKIFMISAAEIVSKRRELASNPVLKEKVNTILKQSQLKFSKLACEMKFNFKDAISDPVIIDVKID